MVTPNWCTDIGIHRHWQNYEVNGIFFSSIKREKKKQKNEPTNWLSNLNRAEDEWRGDKNQSPEAQLISCTWQMNLIYSFRLLKNNFILFGLFSPHSSLECWVFVCVAGTCIFFLDSIECHTFYQFSLWKIFIRSPVRVE